jgi:hypothetical protein
MTYLKDLLRILERILFALSKTKKAAKIAASWKICCERRIRTSTRRLARLQSEIHGGGQSRITVCSDVITTTRLSLCPHPRDKGVCLPISSPHSIKRTFDMPNIKRIILFMQIILIKTHNFYSIYKF